LLILGCEACCWMDIVVGFVFIVYNALQLYESYLWPADPIKFDLCVNTRRQQSPVRMASPPSIDIGAPVPFYFVTP